jgi:ABC-2 type transport system permease protein
MNAFWQILLTQARLFFRDKATLIITIVLPLLLGVFLSMIFSAASMRTINIAVVNGDSGRESKFMMQKLVANVTDPGLKIITADTLSNALKDIEAGKIDLVIEFPEGTSDSISLGTKTNVTVYYNSASVESSGIARNIAQVIIAELNLGIQQIEKVFTGTFVNISKSDHSLAEFYIPNFLAISILWLSIFATAIPIVKQRENKVLLRIGTTPVSKAVFMGAVTTWRLLIGVVQSLLFLTVAIVTLKVNVLSMWPLFLAAIVLGNLTFTAMGYMIASFSKTLASAETISQLFNFIFIFLSGVFFTASMLPDIVVKISFALPLTYMADMFRQIMVGYNGMVPLWVDFTVLAGSGLIFSVISLKCWRWN